MVCGCRPVKSRGAGWTGLGPRSERCRPGHSVPRTDVTGENPASLKGQSWAERTSDVASAAGFPEARHWCLPCGRWALEGAVWELQPDAWGASTLPGEGRTRLGCPWLHLVHSQQGTAGVPSEPWSPCQAAGCWAEQACGRSKPAGAGSAQPGPGEAGFPQLTARTCMAGLQRQGHCRGCGTCQAMGRESWAWPADLWGAAVRSGSVPGPCPGHAQDHAVASGSGCVPALLPQPWSG